MLFVLLFFAGVVLMMVGLIKSRRSKFTESADCRCVCHYHA